MVCAIRVKFYTLGSYAYIFICILLFAAIRRKCYGSFDIWWAFLRIYCALYSAPSFSLGSWTFGLVGHSWVRIYKTNTGIFLISNQLDYILHVNIYIYIHSICHRSDSALLSELRSQWQNRLSTNRCTETKKKLVNYYVNVVNGRNLIS